MGIIGSCNVRGETPHMKFKKVLIQRVLILEKLFSSKLFNSSFFTF